MPDDPATGHADGAPHPEPPAVVARLRAVVVAGHRGDVTAARNAADDREPAVRAAAMGALARAGALEPGDVTAALADPSPAVRLRACQVAAAWPSPTEPSADGLAVVRRAVRAALDDEDELVAEAACWAAGELADQAAVAALADLAHPARGHADPRVREAAVAALGAVVAGAGAGAPGGPVVAGAGAGAPGGPVVAGAGTPPGTGIEDGPAAEAIARAAVLDATQDKPAVRRRAALALAAFEGGSIEAALRQLSKDRDWQVRQVAEELLDAASEEPDNAGPPEGCG